MIPHLIALTQKLISFPSITPHHQGCMTYIENILKKLGFECAQINRNETTNLYAKKVVPGAFHLCFAGHLDVVPIADESKWQFPPFSGQLHNNKIYGRGAVDMKGGLACFLSLLPDLIQQDVPLTLSLILTSDEEGDALDGTQIVVDELIKGKEKIDLCIVGEPTSENKIGDGLKIGRRGSFNGVITVQGEAGHVAYPHKAKNPLPELLHFLSLLQLPLDEGYEDFPKSNLEITSIDTNNSTSNMIPPAAKARFNVRFNPNHTEKSLRGWLEDCAKTINLPYVLETTCSGEAFYGIETTVAENIKKVVESVTHTSCHLNTGGGISDARFLRKLCPTFELGLKNDTAHHDNEHVSIDDLMTLRAIYKAIALNATSLL